MKKLLFLFVLMINGLNAQIINFPDVNFKNSLLNLNSNNAISTYDINSVGVNGGVNGPAINIDLNSNNEIEVNEAQNIYGMQINDGSINDLTGIEYFTNLKTLSINGTNNASLDISSLTNLLGLDLWYGNLSNIIFPTNSKLTSLYILNNNITNLDISSNSELSFLSCVGTQITSLDISLNKKLNYLYCDSNKIVNLNLKNGQLFKLKPTFNKNPTLKYICIDDLQKDSILDQIQFYNYTNVEVNTYCSFTPGGDHNTITGNIIYDLDNNGCDLNDPKNIAYTKITYQEGLNSGITYSDTSGNYNFYTPKGNFQVIATVENPSLFSFLPPTALITFTDSLNNITTQDFCITPIGSKADVEVVLNPIQRARPGFDAHYQLVYKNKGNQTLSGMVNLLFNDSLIDFLSSSITPVASSVGNLTWDYTTLLPFEVKTIDLTFNVNSPAEIPAVNIGDTLKFTATITPVTGDDTPLDNVFNFNQIVVGAYDPNEVTCLEGNIIPPSSIGQYLHYTIDFENTGNYPAENVVVKEIIDPKEFDIKTLQILNSSDKMYTRIKGNQIEYIFEGIQLEEHNHGNILFKLKTRDTLTLGDSVLKSADIYFDYNLPVQTNNSKTTFQNLTAGLTEKMIDQSITVYPNPSNGVYNIRSENQTKQVEVFDAGGRLLLMKIGSDNSSKVDITNQEQGIYFLKITTDKGVKVMEVIKN